MRNVFTLILSFAIALPVSASVTMPDFNNERSTFNQAVNLLNKNKLTEFQRKKKQLKHYPLQHYLTYYALTKNLKNAKYNDIVSFLEVNRDSPLKQRLNRTWLNHLYRQQKWGSYINHFATYPETPVRYQCQLQVANLKGTAKQRKAALYKARELWMVGYSQPKNCDPLFKAWMDTGRPTSQEAAQRFWMSIAQGNIKLARYLNKKISDKKLKKQSGNFFTLYNNPEKLRKTSLQQIPKQYRGNVAALAYKRWFRNQPISATESWVRLRDRHVSDSDLQNDVSQYMGVRLNSRYHSQAIKLSKALDPDYSIPELTEVRIRHALSQQNWQEIAQGVKHLDKKRRDESRWRYWGLMAEMHLNPEQDYSAALDAIAQDRSYYGFLAAELNNSSFQLNAAEEPTDKNQLSQLAANSAVLRSHELHKLGRTIEANREWFQLQKGLNESDREALGYLAKSWGWHQQAIINAAKTKRWNHISLRFPHPHAKLFRNHARKNGLDLSFPVAIARQESAFLPTARSRVGARGLMQLMPKTAKETARKHKVPYRRLSQLNSPKTNITLGSAYLGDMLKRFNGNPAFAAAAYNAGPHRVKRWLKDRGELPLDIWIETIPFKETRKYVKNVLAFRVIYDRLEGRQASLLSDKQIQLLAVNQSNISTL